MSDKFKLRNILQNISTLEKFQSHKRQGKTEELSRIWGGWGKITTKCNVWYWAGSQNRKRTLVENWNNSNKVCSLVKNIVLMISDFCKLCLGYVPYYHFWKLGEDHRNSLYYLCNSSLSQKLKVLKKSEGEEEKNKTGKRWLSLHSKYKYWMEARLWGVEKQLLWVVGQIPSSPWRPTVFFKSWQEVVLSQHYMGGLLFQSPWISVSQEISPGTLSAEPIFPGEMILTEEESRGLGFCRHRAHLGNCIPKSLAEGVYSWPDSVFSGHKLYAWGTSIYLWMSSWENIGPRASVSCHYMTMPILAHDHYRLQCTPKFLWKRIAV